MKTALLRVMLRRAKKAVNAVLDECLAIDRTARCGWCSTERSEACSSGRALLN